jgi:hypothetical protein
LPHIIFNKWTFIFLSRYKYRFNSSRHSDTLSCNFLFNHIINGRFKILSYLFKLFTLMVLSIIRRWSRYVHWYHFFLFDMLSLCSSSWINHQSHVVASTLLILMQLSIKVQIHDFLHLHQAHVIVDLSSKGQIGKITTVLHYFAFVFSVCDLKKFPIITI